MATVTDNTVGIAMRVRCVMMVIPWLSAGVCAQVESNKLASNLTIVVYAKHLPPRE